MQEFEASIREARRRLDHSANAAQIEGALIVAGRAVGAVSGLTAEEAHVIRASFERLPSHVMAAIHRSDASSLKSLIGRTRALTEAVKRAGGTADGIEELLAAAIVELEQKRSKQAADRASLLAQQQDQLQDWMGGRGRHRVGWCVNVSPLRLVNVAPPDPATISTKARCEFEAHRCTLRAGTPPTRWIHRLMMLVAVPACPFCGGPHPTRLGAGGSFCPSCNWVWCDRCDALPRLCSI